MLGHPREHQKSKNERRAAWERFRKMQNERHAAWERFSSPHGPDWCPQKGPPKTPQANYFKNGSDVFWSPIGAPKLGTPKNGAAQLGAKELSRRSRQTFIFKPFFVIFVLRDRLDGLSKHALHFQNTQYRIGFIDVVDALIESMLDHQVATPKSKNERHAA